MSAQTALEHVVTSVDAWMMWWADRPVVHPDDLAIALGRVGRTQGPVLLAELLAAGLLTRELLAPVVGNVWSDDEYPDHSIDHGTWRALFDLAGYTVDGQPALRPVGSLTLYRGSVPERRTDWSWTDNYAVAVRYAEGRDVRRPTGSVWVAQVEPWRLLARNTGRDEDEYVVDTTGLLIEVARG